jgi:fatty-acyl-CoA synthase
LRDIREINDLNNRDVLFQRTNGHPKSPAVSSEDGAQIQYTSGTTSFPKGAVLSHRGLVNNVRFYATRCGVDQKATWINIMPLFHTSECGIVSL